MADTLDYNKIVEELVFDFGRLEKSARVSFDEYARKRIHDCGAELVFSAHLDQSYPPFKAKELKRTARQLAKTAIATKPRLSALWALMDEAFMHGLFLFLGFKQYFERMDLLKQAIQLVGEIATEAEKNSIEPRRGGRPEFLPLKIFTRMLYSVYLNTGGEKRVSYNARLKSYYGDSLYFIREALEQVRRFIPDELLHKILPATPHALTRTIVGAIRSVPTTGKNPPKKTKRKS